MKIHKIFILTSQNKIYLENPPVRINFFIFVVHAIKSSKYFFLTTVQKTGLQILQKLTIRQINK